MYHDQDMKIAGDKPSRDVERNRRGGESVAAATNADMDRAKRLGKLVAERFARESENIPQDGGEGDNSEMLLQRRLLLSFTATVGFERFCRGDLLAGIAQKSFLDTLKGIDLQLYKASSDTGAFSFYYLAFRRGSEIERRMGQTFAMLCSHDGDPIFQELGEALYCWFSSFIQRTAEELELI